MWCESEKEQGFTLVELIIVVAIIAVLASIAIPQYQNYVETAKRQVAQSVINQFPLLLETYKAENPNGYLCPDCDDGSDATDSHTYSYAENDSGTVTTDTISGWLPDFRPRSTSMQAGEAVLYDYSLTIDDSSGTATFTATPKTSRGAPSGNVTGSM